MRLFFFLSFAIACFAHQTGLSYIELTEKEGARIEGVYKKPLSDTRGKDITVEYPSKCFISTTKRKKIENGFIINSFEMQCGANGLLDSKIWVNGLVSSDRGVLIRYVDKENIVHKSLLRSTTPFINISKTHSSYSYFVEYFFMGIFHILGGFDHLSFVLALLLLSKNIRQLLFTVSAFTLSHSLTLVLGIFSIITISIPFVEAMIALSIVLLAKEILMHRTTLTKKHLGFVAFLFGLVHGLGFSSSLSSIGLPQEEIPLSLLAFNLGIEAGQIFFILCASIFLLYLYKIVPKEKSTPLIAYIVGSIATFWFLQRVIA